MYIIIHTCIQGGQFSVFDIVPHIPYPGTHVPVVKLYLIEKVCITVFLFVGIAVSGGVAVFGLDLPPLPILIPLSVIRIG